MKRKFLFAAASMLSFIAFGQPQVAFRSPMDISLFLSGNFGELRSNHFHSGIDIKTGGVTGKKVFAIEDGYVSRIKVQTGGYGKALYIAHPSGYTSVYGHLKAYNEEIARYVQDIQYQRKSHEVDLYLAPGEIEVTEGEVIARSGNTGSSSGPHLHFELRRTSDQHPLNSLLFDFPIADHLPPKIMQAAIYPIGEASQVNNAPVPLYLDTKMSNGTYTIQKKGPIQVYGKIGFGIEVYDYLDGAPNRCGIFSLDLKIDGKQTYYSEMNEFSFAESRFINAHIDYALKYAKNRKVQRLYKLPYDELSIYKYLDNDGAIRITDTLVHEVSIHVTDTYRNGTSLLFHVQGSGMPPVHEKVLPEGDLLPYDRESSFSGHHIELRFPRHCFYDDVDFRFATTDGTDDLYSDIYQLHDGSVPVHSSFDIAVIPDRIPEGWEDRLCLVGIETDGSTTYAGGDFTEGKVTGSLRAFGKYAIGIDTIPPQIKALNLYNGKDISSQPTIRFRVSDDLSGISTYNGTINGQWVLFQYDPKNELLFYEFDGRVSYSEKINELEIVLSDTKGNKANYHTTFIR